MKEDSKWSWKDIVKIAILCVSLCVIVFVACAIFLRQPDYNKTMGDTTELATEPATEPTISFEEDTSLTEEETTVSPTLNFETITTEEGVSFVLVDFESVKTTLPLHYSAVEDARDASGALGLLGKRVASCSDKLHDKVEIVSDADGAVDYIAMKSYIAFEDELPFNRIVTEMAVLFGLELQSVHYETLLKQFSGSELDIKSITAIYDNYKIKYSLSLAEFGELLVWEIGLIMTQ